MDDLSTLNSGLDALESLPAQIKKNLLRITLRRFFPIISALVILIIWQLFITFSHIPSYKLPNPLQVFRSLRSEWRQGALWSAIFTSVSRGAIGFLLAIALATPLGLLLGLNRALRALFRPILVGLQQLPSVAWVPAAVIWFGLSPVTIYAVIMLGAVPSIANGLIAGIDQIPPIVLKVADVMRATHLQRIRHFILPSAWVGYLAGLEQGWAFAWRSLMAAELIAVSPSLGIGIGQLLNIGRDLGDMSLIVGCIIVIMAIGIAIEKLLFAPIRKRAYKNRGLVAV